MLKCEQLRRFFFALFLTLGVGGGGSAKGKYSCTNNKSLIPSQRSLMFTTIIAAVGFKLIEPKGVDTLLENCAVVLKEKHARCFPE